MSLFDLVLSNKLFTERRRVSLYSNFSKLKNLNPDGYEANVIAWKSLLLNAVDQGYFDDLTCISAGPALLESLYDPVNGKLLALHEVIDDLIAERVLIPLPLYKSQSTSIYDQGSLFNPRIIASWFLSKLYNTSYKSIGLNGEPGTLKKEKYLSIAAVERLGDAIWNKLENEVGVTLSYTKGVFTEELIKSFLSEDITITQKSLNNEIIKSKVNLSEVDQDVILLYLVRDRNKLLSDGHVYKVKTKNSSCSITQKDIAVANLRTTISQITARVDGLSNQINHCAQKARHALEVYQNKSVAKYALKSKKLAESSQVKALDMLEKLELVLDKIDDATDQAETISALSSTTTILAEINATIGGAEKVSDLMDKLREQVDETDEIGLEISNLTGRNVNEEEIDEELDDMLIEENQKILNKLHPPKSPVKSTEQEQSQREETAVSSVSHDLDNMHINNERTKILAD